MSLLYHPEALAGIPRDRTTSTQLKVKIGWLWRNRHGVRHLPLSGDLAGFYKRRAGKYRIIYTFDADRDEMVIRLIGPRDTIYKQ